MGKEARARAVARRRCGAREIFWYGDVEQPFDAKLFVRPEGSMRGSPALRRRWCGADVDLERRADLEHADGAGQRFRRVYERAGRVGSGGAAEQPV